MKFYYFAGFVILASCAPLELQHSYLVPYRQHLLAGECEAAQGEIAQEKSSTRYIRFYQGAIGYIGYVSTVPVTLAFDVISLDRCRFGCSEELQKPGFEFLFPTTSFTFEHTKDLRCPDTSYGILKELEIAECFERRGDKKSLQTAFSRLDYLEDSFGNGHTCLKIREYKAISDARARLEKRLAVRR